MPEVRSLAPSVLSVILFMFINPEYSRLRRFFHDSLLGMIGHQSDSDMIWTNPAALSQVMALFVCPLSHKLRYFSQLAKPLYGGALIRREEALQRYVESFPS